MAIETRQRVQSIDVFRAVTMLLMVFVNDVDGVQHIPEWIKHASANEDALGFADTIFPAFLFIVGLSIPLAISNRIQDGDSYFSIILYIVSRAFALLVMGFVHVNLEHYSRAALLPRAIWEIFITVSFFLIWLDYSRTRLGKRKYFLQALGWAVLITMCILFKGEEDGQVLWMRPYWWGILGLIGWSYLICALTYLFSRGRFAILIAAAIFFFLFDVLVHAGVIKDLFGIKNYVWIVGDGSMPAFTMGGVVISSWYIHLISKKNLNAFWWVAPLIGMVMIAGGCAVREFGGISKIHATPSWVGICTGLSVLGFLFFAWLIDVAKKRKWFILIMPAGTATLTCYLIPYLLYSLFELIHFRYPHFFNEGAGGLLRSMIIAFVVVIITGWLQRMRVCIKT
jgi:heparan-alpha-glucosaminide N-acetyltransferase